MLMFYVMIILVDGKRYKIRSYSHGKPGILPANVLVLDRSRGFRWIHMAIQHSLPCFTYLSQW